MSLRAICVFCGSSAGVDPAFAAAARDFGTAVARSGRALVTGGGKVGLMGAVADAALAAGGSVVGVIPRALMKEEVAHAGLTELHVVDGMHARKAMMADRADAFVALPGGLGTLEELFEVWTWGYLGLHRKPLGVLDVGGFFAPLLTFLDRAVDAGFVRAAYRQMLVVGDQPSRLLDSLEAYVPMSSL